MNPSSFGEPALSPLAAYRRRVEAGVLATDPAQAAAAERLDRLWRELSDRPAARGWLGRLFGDRAESPRGLYLWGPVGRGKTMLMDLFFDAAPEPRKRRVHFAAFMLEVHARLHSLRGQGHGGDAVDVLAKDIAGEARLLCFDEFQITDIADAMVLGRLFTGLFAGGVVMVATSNTAPDDLYAGGLQRALFLPFIALLKQTVDIVEVAGDSDHRLGRLRGRPRYLVPADGAAEAELGRIFRDLAAGAAPHPATIAVPGGRRLDIPRAGPKVAWFDAPDLIGEAVSSADYLALAERYDTVILSRIPRLAPEQRNEARRLIALIDVLYDAGTRLIASAEAPPEQLYAKGLHAREFERTASRLIEMQSDDWADDWADDRADPDHEAATLAAAQ
jgi:cell division protein ZapE